jgi:2-dehydro-3-deoxy-D-arabinonate dehydratase
MTIRLYQTQLGVLIEKKNHYFKMPVQDWDLIVNRSELERFLESFIRADTELPEDFVLKSQDYLPPIGGQEVWAAGVTYRRSRTARMEESEKVGGGSFYDRVYTAQRPELFPKALAHRVAGYRQKVRIREDSHWNVPEPELTVLASSQGDIVGYTIGNDVSSRDIEGENPLYLPQAKVYNQSCALGPGILVKGGSLTAGTQISMRILRASQTVFEGTTALSEMKRTPEELIEYLYRECSFPNGCFLMTGTGIVPPPDFSLQSGDEIEIAIEGIGCLINPVA